MYTRDATTTAVNHLRDVHGIVGGKSVAVAKKKAYIDAADKESKLSKLYKENPRSSAIPVVHLNLGLWTSKVSKEKYVGVRIYFIDIYWGLKSYILAIKRFDPSSDLIKGNRLSDILQMWLRDILAEFGIRITNIAGSSSHGGSDVKRAMTSPDDSKLWEWCIPHMKNPSVQDAFDTSLDPKKSNNAAARDLVSAVKSLIEHFNKSSNSQTCLAEFQKSDDG
ncbi:hypothetical protein PsorP6_004322 [Peronosclerospora sorghi]|uniref:Uncharacterized protein n=1 Tax=Peronosclerospora sorghi TaxID=230839 RepID=A0ACC0VJT4_9STRA|nr:hypothetical protein PsorP6_004322 [Peronosclerospora sorghi]